MARRRIAVVTGGRADWGPLHPVVDAIAADPALELALIVCGDHLADADGARLKAFSERGLQPTLVPGLLPASDQPVAAAEAMGAGTANFARAYQQLKPDLLVLLGDRFEILSAAAAAIPLGLPIAHIHGGEVTEGAFDEQIRHALTKVAHLHFVATEQFKHRVLQMGEMPERVFVSGAPGLDAIAKAKKWPVDQLAADLGIVLDPAPLLVTYHPETLSLASLDADIDAVLGALDDIGRHCVVTHPNADPGGKKVLERCREFVERRPGSVLVAQLGSERYFSLMSHAAAMVGNSSSGIIEAASFGLPVVNIGDRQKGRPRGPNVLDVPADRGAIGAAIKKAAAPEFRASLRTTVNPYGDGNAAERIAGVLRSYPLSQLARKIFRDIDV